MAWIRVFKSKSEAERAKEILAEGGIDSYITEEDIYGIPIVLHLTPAFKFKLNVKTREEYFEAAKYLAKLLKK